MNTHHLRKAEFIQEIQTNILPFWMSHSPDPANGGFYGAVMNNLEIRNDTPRSAILCTRILWTFSAAYQKFKRKSYLKMANYAYAYIMDTFHDPKYEGLFWDVNSSRQPVTDRKHHYAQAFAIYSLCEYSSASGNTDSLAYAKTLYNLLESHAYEPLYRGYIEGSSRDWSTLADMRLSEKDMNCRKSMNTMLHMMEGYTGLLKAWQDEGVRAQLANMLDVFINHIIDPQSGHLRLFFDDQWHSLSNTISFGHDIECSWLLWEAAQTVGDAKLSSRVFEASLKLAYAVLRDGMDSDGSLFQEFGPQGINHADKEWWSQAEGVVGFTNAYQLSGDKKFLRAAEGTWAYIQEKLIDREYGDWIKHIRPDGTPNQDTPKIGPWECPYHHARMCLEMIERLR